MQAGTFFDNDREFTTEPPNDLQVAQFIVIATRDKHRANFRRPREVLGCQKPIRWRARCVIDVTRA
jgi:hypothetical protein